MNWNSHKLPAMRVVLMAIRVILCAILTTALPFSLAAQETKAPNDSSQQIPPKVFEMDKCNRFTMSTEEQNDCLLMENTFLRGFALTYVQRDQTMYEKVLIKPDAKKKNARDKKGEIREFETIVHIDVEALFKASVCPERREYPSQYLRCMRKENNRYRALLDKYFPNYEKKLDEILMQTE